MDTYYVTVDEDDVHEVKARDGEFYCSDCEACGLQDGYLNSQSGAREWHNDL